MLGISMTNALPRIAPWDRGTPFIGNNPLSISLPGPEFPIVLDIANTVVANGKIRTCPARGKPLRTAGHGQRGETPPMTPQKR
jgi:LDH2 family malate/lactate/ureidoglycolate dehydrogenase